MPVAAEPVRLRECASLDIGGAADHYRDQAGVVVALRFIGVVERVTRRIGRNPQLGALGFAYELGIPGLRSLPLDRFPYLVFYVERDDYVDVWRVLHTKRDIPGTLLGQPPDEPEV